MLFRINEPNKNYMVIGNYGNFNIGDEILLKQVIKEARDFDAKFFIPTRNKGFIKLYHTEIQDVLATVAIDPLDLTKSFSKCKTIIIGGGGIWSRYTGKLAHLIPIVAIIGKALGKTVIFKGIGIYRTAAFYDKFLVNLAILFSDSCSVRDRESFEILWKLNRKRTEIVNDLAIDYIKKHIDIVHPKIALDDNKQILKIKEIKSAGRFIVGISVKPTTDKNINQKLVQEFALSIESLTNQYGNQIYFVFFPFAKTESNIESDDRLVQQILKRVSSDFSHLEENKNNYGPDKPTVYNNDYDLKKKI